MGNFNDIHLAYNPRETVTNICGNLQLTEAFTTANQGIAVRFIAPISKDIKSFKIQVDSVTSPGTITGRIETVDGSTGKPSGTLYDANATKSFTPTAGINTVTFDTLPTTGLTIGNSYCLVLLKDDSGTTCTIRERIGGGSSALPVAHLEAADGTTRSNFTENTNTIPIAAFVDEDDDEWTFGCSNAFNRSSNNYCYSADVVVAQKIVLNNSVTARGYTISQNAFRRVGTPAGDLRIRLLDNTNSAISGATVTVDKEELLNADSDGLWVLFGADVEVASGTYRIAMDSASSANASNCFGFRTVEVLSSAALPTGWCYSISTNASTSFTWTDTTDQISSLGLILSDLPTATGGGGGGASIIGGTILRG